MSRFRALLDTNVILDWLFSNRPQHREAMALFEAIADCRLDAFVTPTSLATVSYIAGRVLAPDALSEILRDIRELCDIASQDSGVVDAALRCEEPDFEDALILSAARAAGCTVIVSRDERAFRSFEGTKVDERGCLALV